MYNANGAGKLGTSLESQHSQERSLRSDIKKVTLHRWLKSKDEALAARVLEVREEVSKWLPYVAQYFPHYPSHGLDHSDRIVAQLSRLLFNEGKLVLPFSTAEVYCLLCSAYLHDMGMVVCPGEVAEILASDEWTKFVADDATGQANFRKYSALRDGPVHGTRERTRFLADQVLRNLIAEFVRREHHARSRTSLELHPFLRQLVDDGDSVAFETIADLAVGHGLADDDLADENRFPEQRDVFDGKVNVRFLTRLLRIGDLLDMSSKRADPITARAIGPLPGDAVPHWQQYSSKKHENITPEVIEFTFECKTQETHRVLRDWFSWLEAEVRAAGLEQLHAARHDKWKPPRCLVCSQANADAGTRRTKPTIIVKPTAKATYTFHDWKLEVDQERILERLIHDVYDNPVVFVRELIQNALDATRCQMYADFAAQNPGTPAPECPTRFSADFRSGYAVRLSLSEEDVHLSADGPMEKRAVFSIEDHGIGMTEDIIVRYFLQVGRSYYQSNEFRQRYRFAPTSRFGIGFLSVFAVSKDVTVETATRDTATNKLTGIRLRLREPRNYLLTESWLPFEERAAAAKTGTRIRVVLNDWQLKDSLASLVREWCVAVEVPIIVTDGAGETVIRPEQLVDKTVLASSKANPDAQFILRAWNITYQGVEGQVGVMAYEDASGEGWCDCWPTEKDLGGNRLDEMPKVHASYTALHGVKVAGPPIGLDRSYGSSQWLARCDVRSAAAAVPLARLEAVTLRPLSGLYRAHRGDRTGAIGLAASAVEQSARRAVETHLSHSVRARGPRGVYYIGKVLSSAPVEDCWREKVPGTVVTWQRGNRVDVSVGELLALDRVVVAAWLVPWTPSKEPRPPMKRHPKEACAVAPIVSWSDTPAFSDERFLYKLERMNLIDVQSDEDLWLLTFAAGETTKGFYRAHPESQSWVIPGPFNLAGFDTYGRLFRGAFSRPGAVRCEFLGRAGKYFHMLDRTHEVIGWLCALRQAAAENPATVNPAHVEACWRTASTAPYHVGDMLADWEKAAAVPEALRPPKDASGRLADFRYIELRCRATVIPGAT